jgi:hypothetical protein
MKKNNRLSKITEDYRFIFLVTSVIFAVFLRLMPIVNDDAINRSYGKVADHFSAYCQYVIYQYHTWSSRILINFLMFFFENHYFVLFPIFAGICMYLMQRSMSVLFDRTRSREISAVIAAGVMLFPWHYMIEAGWVATLSTYFCPAAFGMTALVPLRKILDRTHMAWWEYPAYMICLIYAANNEQILIVLLFTYLCFAVYLLFKKRFHVFMLIQIVLLFGSLAFTLTCPGNQARTETQTSLVFQTYGMLRLTNKLDIGFSTSANWLLFGSMAFSIFMCTVLAITIWKKYKSVFYRAIAVFPCLVVILFGPLLPITKRLIPGTEALVQDVPEFGLVNAVSYFDSQPFVKYMVMGICIILIALEFILALDGFQDLIFALALVIAGFGSRMATAFSPSVYASLLRIGAVMALSMTTATVMVYERNVEQNTYTAEFRKDFQRAMYVVIAFGFFSLLLSLASKK